MTKIIEYVKENKINVGVFTVLFLLIFVFPNFAYTDGTPNAFLTVIHIITGLIVVGLIVYYAKMFIDNNKNTKLSENQLFVNVSGSITAIIIGLFFGFVLMLAVSFLEAFPGIFIIVRGGFRDVQTLGKMISFSVPFIFTGLSVAFAFKTGLFNIGAPGQFMVGALVATYIGYKFVGLGEISPFLHWGVAVIAAFLAGALWGSVPGFLKAYRNVNEVVTSIMMNYIAAFLSVMIINMYMFNGATGSARYIQSTAYTPTLGLDKFFPGTVINGSIIIALIVVFILHVILNKTTFGYELKAVGFNRDAAKYSGMNSRRNIVISMIISGSVAGLAGGLMYLAPGIRLPASSAIMSEGFTGIAISLLGLSSPIGVLFAGLFYGSLKVGGNLLQALTFTPEIIDIIIAVIIYASALSLIIRSYVIKVLKKREVKKLEEDAEGSDE